MEEKDQNKSNSKSVVFISGKMRGLQDLGRYRFAKAAEFLKRLGFIVLDPSVLPIGMRDDAYMPICLAMIDAADCVYMLSNWHDSQGANIEQRYADCQGKRIIYEEEDCEWLQEKQ